jgi:gliding motility-associated-like protein
MENRDYIKDLFSEKLGQLEVPVRAEIWSAVSSQMAASAPAAAGLSIFSKIIIGVSVAASVAITSYIVTRENNESPIKQPTAKENTLNTEESVVNPTLKDVKVESVKDLNKTVNPENNQEIVEQEIDQNSNLQVILPGNHIIEETPVIQQEKKTQEIVQVEKEVKSLSKEENVIVAPSHEEPIILESSVEIKLFNTFTPNNDGVNDFLFVESKGLQDFNLVVLDRSNKIVYQTTDADFKWNGIGLNNELVPSGMYVYYLTAKDSSGNPISKYSSLEIIK